MNMPNCRGGWAHNTYSCASTQHHTAVAAHSINGCRKGACGGLLGRDATASSSVQRTVCFARGVRLAAGTLAVVHNRHSRHAVQQCDHSKRMPGCRCGKAGC